MPNWIYADGRLGWLMFAVLAYAGLGVLVADYVWRRVTMSAKRLLAIMIVAWTLGLLILIDVL